MTWQLRIARVHVPCVIITVLMQMVVKEISSIIVGSEEDSIDATWKEAEAGDGLRVHFYIVVLKYPGTVSWWKRKSCGLQQKL